MQACPDARNTVVPARLRPNMSQYFSDASFKFLRGLARRASALFGTGRAA